MNKLPKDVERIWGSGTPVKVKPRPKKRKANKTKLEMLETKIEILEQEKEELIEKCHTSELLITVALIVGHILGVVVSLFD